MSPLVITLLIGGGIALLIVIAYINHLVESNKLEKARQKADLNDRIRRCMDVSERLPGQLMSPPLKLMLSNLELRLRERLLPLDKQNATLRSQMDELRSQVGKGESITVSNAPAPILNEAKAKDVRFLLENLHSLVSGSVQIGLLPANEGKHWIAQARQLLVQVHIEFFGNIGQNALRQNHPGQARLAFERGVQYLRKQPQPQLYQSQLKRFEELLAEANALVLNRTTPSADEPSELTEGLKSLEDDDWKKKNIYD